MHIGRPISRTDINQIILDNYCVDSFDELIEMTDIAMNLLYCRPLDEINMDVAKEIVINEITDDLIFNYRYY